MYRRTLMRPADFDYSRVRHTALDLGSVGIVWTFFFRLFIPPFCLPLSGRRSDIDWNTICLKSNFENVKNPD